MYERTIEEHHVPGKRLGRHVAHDPRSKEYPAETAATIISVKHPSYGLPLDQGQLGSCTANACVGALNSLPNFSTTQQPRTENDALELYGLETKLEGDPYPPNDPGGTGLYVCRAAKQLGWVKSYRHAFGLEHALQALVVRPIIIGVDWYEGFDTPDPASGLVRISGQVRGGHELVVTELDEPNKLIGLENSWGPGWGLGGRFYMDWSTFEQLLEQDGDATVPHAPTA